MVGDPKRLSDLAKIHADVRIRCRDCRFEEDWTIEALSGHLLATGGSTTWSEITRHLCCRRVGCGSPRVRAIPVPYARRQANAKRRIGRLNEDTVATAVQVLENAVARSPGRMVATIEIRLALMLVHKYIRDPAPVRLLWERAGNGGRTSDQGLHEPLSLIRARLEQQGWLAPRVLTETNKDVASLHL
jgi:hypothetical protein